LAIIFENLWDPNTPSGAARFIKIQSVVEKRNYLYSGEGFEKYRLRRYGELLNLISSRKKVYLDTKFWIWLRQPESSPEPNKSYRLLVLLWKGVKSGKVFCPVSYPAFTELAKIYPKGKRLNQAKLMDTLSLGIGLRNPFDISESEYLQTIVKHQKQISFPLWINPVWGPVGHIIGELYPTMPRLPHQFMEEGKKFMLEAGWIMSMQELAMLDEHSENKPKTAEKINKVRRDYPRDGKSFKKLFEEELHGILDTNTTHIENAIFSLASVAGIPANELSSLDQRHRNAFINLFREASVKKRDPEIIPSQRVRAALHAAIRMDDGRPFRENDLEDISHSSVAAAYCDLFFTERSFSELLNRSAVREFISTSCHVTHNIDEAISLVEDIISN